jgi:hypothetical protein
VLQAEPAALLRMCQLRREFALGGLAAARFALPEADVAALRLSEWLDARVAGASVDSAVSQLAAHRPDGEDEDDEAGAGDGDGRPALDFDTLRAPLSPPQRLMLCLDVAAAAAAAPRMCRRLLGQAGALLPEAQQAAQARAPALMRPWLVRHARRLCVGTLPSESETR